MRVTSAVDTSAPPPGDIIAELAVETALPLAEQDDLLVAAAADRLDEATVSSPRRLGAPETP
jgi:hypothetical protein